MQYTNLGSSGLRVSGLCLGAAPFGDPKLRPWALTAEESFPIVREAIELGVNFFDTAEIYSWGQSEVILGQALKEFAEHREDVVAATKVSQVENTVAALDLELGAEDIAYLEELYQPVAVQGL